MESFSNKNFGFGATIALVTVLLLAVLSAFAVRNVLRAAADENGS